MQTSIFIAKIMGPVLVVVALAVAINRDHFKSALAEAVRFPMTLLVVGILTLTMGLAVVNTHNVWTADWRVIITLFGWLAILGGIVRTACPAFTIAMAEKAAQNWNTMQLAPAALFGLLGLLLTYQGYLA